MSVVFMFSEVFIWVNNNYNVKFEHTGHLIAGKQADDVKVNYCENSPNCCLAASSCCQLEVGTIYLALRHSLDQ